MSMEEREPETLALAHKGAVHLQLRLQTTACLLIPLVPEVAQLSEKCMRPEYDVIESPKLYMCRSTVRVVSNSRKERVGRLGALKIRSGPHTFLGAPRLDRANRSLDLFFYAALV